MTQRTLYFGMMLPAVIAGVVVGFFFGNLADETKMPGEAVRTTDATGHWVRYTEHAPDVNAEIITNTRIRLVMQAIPTYALLNAGRLPETPHALVTSGLLGAETVLDGWGRPFELTVDAAGERYSVRSLGPDGVPSEDDIPRE